MSSQRILEKWKLWFKNQNLICNKLESWRHIEIIFHFLVSNHENLTKATKIWHEKLFFLCSNLSNSIWNTNYTVWSRFETAKCHSTSCSSFKGKQLLSWCWIPDLIRKKKHNSNLPHMLQMIENECGTFVATLQSTLINNHYHEIFT